MNRPFNIATASLLVVLVCAACDSPAAQLKSAPQTPELCPENHTDLMMVPVLYGIPHGDEKTLDKVKNYKAVWAGTCVVGPEKERLVCQTCGYNYLPRSFSWEKKTQDSANFDPPLNKVLAKFCLPFQATYSYRRVMKSDDIIEDNLYIGFENIEHENRADVLVKELLVTAGASDIKSGTLTIYEESSVRESLMGSGKLVAESEGERVEVLILIRAERTILVLTVQ